MLSGTGKKKKKKEEEEEEEQEEKKKKKNRCGTTTQDVFFLSFLFPFLSLLPCPSKDYLILALIAERTKRDATYLLTIAQPAT